jgi:hypothetical protein
MFDAPSKITIKPKSDPLIRLNSSMFLIFDTWCMGDGCISMGFLCARTNMEVDAAFAFFVDTLAFCVMTTNPTFTVCLHTKH